MNTRLTITAAVFLAMPFAALAALNAAAQTINPASSAAPEMSSDYCEDYTDRATSAGAARSAYIPGSGYLAKSESELRAATQHRQDLARLLALSKRLRGESQ